MNTHQTPDEYMQNTPETQQLADFEQLQQNIDNGTVSVEDGNTQKQQWGWL